MGEPTLVAFLLSSVHHAGSVDLYGSWDNFSKPYPMTKDTQKGHGHWYGCHEFKNVICDGDPSNCTMPEDRPLRMGGTYWYYYKRDGDAEFHNPSEPFTSLCPLIPGQTVNEINVPHLMSSAFGSKVNDGSVPGVTMDISMRWKTPQPPRRSKPRNSTQPRVPTSSRVSWFSQSLGRLQTAVTEHILTGFQGIELDKPKQKHGRLPHRPVHTSDGLAYTCIDDAVCRQPSLRRGPIRSTEPGDNRPKTRTGLLTCASSQQRSASLFSNPFETSEDLTYAETLSRSSSFAQHQSRPQEGLRPFVPTNDLSLPNRSKSTSVVKGGSPNLKSTSHLPRRSKTQVPHQKPFIEWHKRQAVADPPRETDNTSYNLELSPKSLAHNQYSEVEYDTQPPPLISNNPLNDSEAHNATALSLSLLDLNLSGPKATSAKAATGTKYDSIHDLWTPATSPSKDHSHSTSTSPSNRSSLQLLNASDPISPATSPLTEWAASVDTSNRPPPPPTRPPPAVPDFAASQETIKAVDVQKALDWTGALEIGVLPFERAGEGHGCDGDNALGDLGFLGAAIL